MKRFNLAILTLLLLTAMTGLYMSEHLKSPKGGDLDPTAFKEQLQHQPGMIIDVRTRQEYEEGHLAETDKLIDFMAGDFEEKIRELDKNETYYLYCRTGNRSGKAMEIMQDAGFREVYNIGGYQDLVSAGLDPE